VGVVVIGVVVSGSPSPLTIVQSSRAVTSAPW
jgi:hypothetical protein